MNATVRLPWSATIRPPRAQSSVGTRLHGDWAPSLLVRSLIAGRRLPDFAAGLLRPFDDPVRTRIRAQQIASLPPIHTGPSIHTNPSPTFCTGVSTSMRSRDGSSCVIDPHIRMGRVHRERRSQLQAREWRARRHWRHAARRTASELARQTAGPAGLGQQGAGLAAAQPQQCAPGKSAWDAVNFGFSSRAGLVATVQRRRQI